MVCYVDLQALCFLKILLFSQSWSVCPLEEWIYGIIWMGEIIDLKEICAVFNIYSWSWYKTIIKFKKS